MATKMTKELIDRIFKEPGIKYELTEFETLGKPVHKILSIYPKTVETGRDAGKTKYYLKSFVPFSSGKEEVQVHVEGGKSAPEEIVRQLWVYKLIHQYGYQADEIDLEKSVQFGTEVGTKAADIIVYTDTAKETPKIIVECKKPKRKDGIEQLKSYMNAKGAPVAVWSNGSDSIILYRPYPKEFENTLFDIPKLGQEPKDVLEAKKTLLQLKKEFNFKEIIQGLEELVLADSGKDEFNEIFKLIFAKIWDEKEAQEKRKGKVVKFGKALDPDITFDCMEIDGITQQWEGSKADLRSHLKRIKADQKAALKKLKDKQKIKQRTYKAEIKYLEKAIPEAETAVKLELILADPDLIGTLKERWIAAEVVKRLDYPIFMAVTERGGKNNSGDYEYLVDEDGSLVEFPDGHPQEGQLVVDQDLVNYDLTEDDLSEAAKIPNDHLCVAEVFVRFVQEQEFDFWEAVRS